MLQTPNIVFVESSNSTWLSSFKALLDTHMAKESVRDHCLTMISYFSETKILGAKFEQL